jgi:hypothetical protein
MQSDDLYSKRLINSLQSHSKKAQIVSKLSTSASLDLSGIRLVASIHSLNADKEIGPEGAIILSKALKSNNSLASLNLSGNRLVASFRSHSIQGMVLDLKEQLNYLKHSNQTQLSLH